MESNSQENIDKNKLLEIELEQKKLLEPTSDEDSVDSDGFSKGDPYAATAKRILKNKNRPKNQLSTVEKFAENILINLP